MYYHHPYHPHKTGFRTAPTHGNIVTVPDVAHKNGRNYKRPLFSSCEILGSNVDGA